MKRLTQKQRMFCDWYIKLANGTQAAIKAGYSERSAVVTASRLLTKANTQAYLTIRRTQLEDLLGFNKSTVLQDLHAIKAKSMQAKPVMEFDRAERRMVQATARTEDGEEIGIYEFDSNGANRAIENINKMMGYNEPEKVEDVTPLENRKSTVIVVKEYVNTEQDTPAA